MIRRVVDASVAVKWFLPEVHAGAARRLLRDGVELHAPDLIRPEVGNILWKKWRAGEIDAGTARGILHDFNRFPVEIHDSGTLLEIAWDVAEGSGRTFYDSLYVAAAIGTGGRLVTADSRLVAALKDGPLGKHVVWVEEA